MFGISDRSYTLILNAFSDFSEIDEVILFGSRAKGNYSNGSDIDIAIKGSRINFSTILKISSKLNEDIPVPYYFDVIDYSKISNQNLRNHITWVGKVLYSAKDQTIRS